MRKIRSLYAVWIALCVPAIVILYQYAVDNIGYGTALSLSGHVSVWLLITALAATSLRRILPSSTLTRNILKYRRALGVASFGYAALHLLIYLVKKADAGRIISEGIHPEILTGWIAFFILVALAATSRNAAVRRMGENWIKLHRFAYFAAALVAAHWMLTAFDPISAYVHSIIIAGLIFLRLHRKF